MRIHENIIVEVTKDLIKFVVQMIILLLIFSVVFDPQGTFMSNIFNYMAYAEPILLQDHISSAISVATDIEGEFITEIPVSGFPYVIDVYSKDKIYVSVAPSEDLLNTKYYGLKPTVINTNCYVPKTRIILEEGIRSRVYIIKKIFEGVCEIYVSPGPDISKSAYMKEQDVEFFEDEDAEPSEEPPEVEEQENCESFEHQYCAIACNLGDFDGIGKCESGVCCLEGPPPPEGGG